MQNLNSRKRLQKYSSSEPLYKNNQYILNISENDKKLPSLSIFSFISIIAIVTNYNRHHCQSAAVNRFLIKEVFGVPPNFGFHCNLLDTCNTTVSMRKTTICRMESYIRHVVYRIRLDTKCPMLWV